MSDASCNIYVTGSEPHSAYATSIDILMTLRILPAHLRGPVDGQLFSKSSELETSRPIGIRNFCTPPAFDAPVAVNGARIS